MSQSAKKPLLSHLVRIWQRKTKEEIYAAILCGDVAVDGIVVRNHKALVSPQAEFTQRSPRFVGRGGDKLNGVLDKIDFNPAGKVCLDAGASTGGFTDCLLRREASHVHAADVCCGKLAWKLKTDIRVTVHERTNIMHLQPGALNPPPLMAVADLAFRSLRGAAAQLLRLTRGGPVLVLAKPQFENPEEEGFSGVVTAPKARRKAVLNLIADLRRESVYVRDAVLSPLTGHRGNMEFFLLLSNVCPADESRAAMRLEEAFVESEQWHPYLKSSRPSGEPTQ
ncbi:MAG: hypothetical protein B0D92_03435 [Spirochaeta sp. LUC14_002_19_P3]|nr:MAG: hypothetical protein B0D92_03435 [Spirochaeta sp. LUC14_002_19_P3]